MDDAAFSAMYEQATREGQWIRDHGLYAVEARIEESASEDYLVIHYANGAEYRFPVRLLQCVCDMSPEQRRKLVLEDTGDAVRWDDADWDIDIPALLEGCYGTVKWMEGETARFRPQAPEPTPA